MLKANGLFKDSLLSHHVLGKAVSQLTVAVVKPWCDIVVV